MAKKKTNLQPWLDYFKMLQRYETKGFLQMNPKEHEAYITRAALLTLVPKADGTVTDPAPNPAPTGVGRSYRKDSIDGQGAAAPLPSRGGAGVGSVTPIALLNRLRAYAALRAAAADPSAISHQPSYISAPFAVHIVKEDYPHDLLLTLLLQQKRSWRTAWRTVDTIEVIDYTEKAGSSHGANSQIVNSKSSNRK